MDYTDVFVLNVGAGSCTVIKHPSGRLTMVDINNSKELTDEEEEVLKLAEARSFEALLDDPVSWMEDVFPGEDLWRFILSHPDADHMEGLHRLLGDLEIDILHFWDLPHSKEMPEKFRTVGQQRDWEVYKDFREHPDAYEPKLLTPMQGSQKDYWAQDGLDIVSPSEAFLEACEAGTYDSNNLSRVIRLGYAGRSVLIPGDVESKGWAEIADTWPEALPADVLIASHHGRMSGYPGDAIMEIIDPDSVLVSTGYVKPDHDAVPLYRRDAETVISTRTDGTLLIRIWADGELKVGRLADGEALRSLPPIQRFAA